MSETKKQNDFDVLLEYLRQNRGFDLSGYKRTTLSRRVNKRIQTVGIEHYDEYMDYLEVHPEEFEQLFNTILINVTGFFRDPKGWEFINTVAIPRIIDNKKAGYPIRVWSAGCASGEEAYSITMMLAEHLGMNEFKKRVKVYATDLDEEALAKARLAVYSESEVKDVPPELLEKYFERNGGRYTFNKELRRSVIFGRHDLLQDAPISRIDLLLCRNILMYFNSEAQSRILGRLNYALNEDGYMFLGKAEMLLTHLNLFTPVDLPNRIFTKVPSAHGRERLLLKFNNGGEDTTNPSTRIIQLRDSAFRSGSVAEMIVDVDGFLVMINDKARRLFDLSMRDLGRPFHDLDLSYRPVDLRSSIDQAYQRKNEVDLKDVEFSSNWEEKIYLDVHLIPLTHNGGTVLGISISFFDVTEHKQLQMQLVQANQDLETAMEELQATNEELETTNEELQSTIEELETTNEELQSTNEELETMNEELQSTNEELETMNDEMSQRTEEVNHLNAFLESIMTSLRGGVVVMDKELNVQIWNKRSEDLWGMRLEEVKEHNFFGLDIGIPMDQLRKPVRSILNNEVEMVELEINATNRRGRSVICDVICTPLYSVLKEIQGVILIIEQKVVVGES